MKIKQYNFFNVDLWLFDTLEEPFLTACEDLFYGESKAATIRKLVNRGFSEANAKKLYKSAFYFMGDDEQPKLSELLEVLPDTYGYTAEVIDDVFTNYQGKEFGDALDVLLNFQFESVEVLPNPYGVSVKLLEKRSNLEFLLDFWQNSDNVGSQWNQYCFHLTDEEDCLRHFLQEQGGFTETAYEAAYNYLIEAGVIDTSGEIETLTPNIKLCKQ